MADEEQQQISLPSLAVILVLSGLIIRYLFFSPSAAGGGTQGAAAAAAARSARADPAALVRSREAAVERIQQMFPQVDRRTVLWDLQRTGGSVAATTERILAGRLETPPITFQPPPPPGGSNTQGAAAQAKPTPVPAHPDLITRYNLKDRVDSATSGSEGGGDAAAAGGKSNSKGWSSNRDERQSLLQKRRDQMILEARRKMEAKIAAEKAAAGTS